MSISKQRRFISMDNKKNTILIVITLALVLVTLVYVVLAGAFKTTAVATSGAAQAEDSVTVYGQGKVSIEPDIAYITFGYENLDPDPQKAQNENSSQMDKIINAVKGAGIEDADIQTSQYNVNQEYDYVNDDRKIKGYRVTNTIRVKIREVDEAGDIIKLAYDAGSNLFYGITFDIIKRQDAYLQALDIALERAGEKAQKLAGKTGRKVTGVIDILESQATYSPYYSSRSNYAIAAAEAPMADYNGDSISSGELEISAIVNVTYRLS